MSTMTLQEIESLYKETNANIEKISDALHSLWGGNDPRSNIVRNVLLSKLGTEQSKTFLEEAVRLRKNLSAEDIENPFLMRCLADIYHALVDRYYTGGDYAKAESLLLQKIANEVGISSIDGHPREAWVAKMLGNLYNMQNRHSIAGKKYREALEIMEKQGNEEILIADILWRLAWSYHRVAQYQRASELFEKSWKILENTDGDFQRKGKVLNAQAWTFRAVKEYGKAENNWSRALEYFEKNKSMKEIAVVKHNLGLVNLEERKFKEAEKLYKSSHDIIIARFPQDHSFLSKLLTRWAETHISKAELFNETEAEKKADWRKAEKLLREAAPLIEKCHEFRYGMIFHGLRARLYKNQGDFKQSVDDLKCAMGLANEIRKFTPGNAEDRSKISGTFYGIFETMIRWQWEWCQLPEDERPKSGKIGIEEAYEAMERSRSQSLRELIHANGINFYEGMDEMEAARLRNAFEQAQKDFLSLMMKSTADSNLLNDAEQRYRNIEAEILENSPNYKRIIQEEWNPLPFEEIKATFDREKTLVLEYFVGQDGCYLFAYGNEIKPQLYQLRIDGRFGLTNEYLTRKDLDYVLLNKDDGIIRQLASKPRDMDNIEELHVYLKWLWEILVPDGYLREMIIGECDETSRKKLLILPDGPLTQLPFETLVVSGNENRPKYIFDGPWSLVYSPSANMYQKLKASPPQGQNSALTVGNAVYGSSPGSVSDADKSLDDTTRGIPHYERIHEIMASLSSLPHTKNEIKAVRDSCHENNVDVDIFEGENATKANVVTNIVNRSLVHLACHGVSEDRQGELVAFLAFTIVKPNDHTNNGCLVLAEIFKLDMKSCQLAILSACDTNSGTHQHGEGTWSIGRGFLAAGSRRVVASDWKVDDKATATLIAKFIENVHKNTNSSGQSDFAESLYEAKKEIKNSDTWSHPYYWSPFVLIGTY